MYTIVYRKQHSKMKHGNGYRRSALHSSVGTIVVQVSLKRLAPKMHFACLKNWMLKTNPQVACHFHCPGIASGCRSHHLDRVPCSETGTSAYGSSARIDLDEFESSALGSSCEASDSGFAFAFPAAYPS